MLNFYIKNWILPTLIGVIVLVSIGLYGCLEQIDLPPPMGEEEALVIQGTVLKSSPSIISVSISSLFTFNAISQRRVSAKLVEVLDETGRALEVPELGQGLYGIEIPDNYPDFSIEFGKSYQLHVVTRDDREYFTSYEPLNEVIKPDSLSLEIVEVQVLDADGMITSKDKLRVSVSTSTYSVELDQPARLKWDVERTYRVTDSSPFPVVPLKTCYLTEQVVGSNLRVFDANESTSDRLEKFKIYESSLSSAFAEGAYVHIYQQSISAGAYKYWSEAISLIERTGNMFEPTAGVISTNLRNPDNSDDLVFGYFYCYAQDTMRVYISPDFAKNPRPTCPPIGGARDIWGQCTVPVCCDCLSPLRSTLEKPEYWTH